MIYLAGSGRFGAAAAQHLVDAGHTICGVAAPALRPHSGAPDLLALWAERHHLTLTPPGELRARHVPDDPDRGLLLTAHSHAFVGRATRRRVRYAMGYHPSLLPLHRGRDAVRWQSRLHERVVGGTIYHLTDRVDGGQIALQEHLIVQPGLPPRELWHEHLFPLGLRLLVAAANLSLAGAVPFRPQDDSLATWEPALDGAPLYRPELLQLPGAR